MLYFEIKDEYKPLLAQHGLNSFSDVFSYNKGEIVDKNRKRCVVRFALYDASRGVDRVFYLKLFHTCALQENMNSILEWGYPKSEARTEWDNACVLEQQGFLSIPCAAYGENKKWGMVKESFFMSEEIADSESLDLLYSSLNREIKQQIMTELGHIVKRLHEKCISFPDLYTKHLFFNKQDLAKKKITVSLIDLHRMRKKKRLSSADKIRDLAALIFTLQPLCVHNEIADFIRAYMHNSCVSAKWYKSLDRRINRLQKRRSTQRGILIRHINVDECEMYMDEEYYPFFETHDMLTYDAVFDFKTGKKKFTDNPGRTVQRFTLKHVGGEHSFFIKKHSLVRKSSSVKKIISFAENEWRKHLLCKKLGINVPIPVAWGYSKKRQNSFLITAEIENNSALDVLLQQEKIQNQTDKATLINTIALYGRALHTNGYCHKDFYTGHFLIKNRQGSGIKPDDIFLIDLQRICRTGIFKQRWFIKDLAQLNFSADFSSVTLKDRIAFLHKYFGVRKLTLSQKKFAKKVDRKTQKIYGHIPKVLRRKNIHSWDEIPNAEQKVEHSV